jgi:DedD protein
MEKNQQPAVENGATPVEKTLRSDGLKQRLIGAIVLVSLAVIFLPMIFDQPHQEKKNIVIPIPDRPPEKLVTFESPKPPELKATGAKEKSLEMIHSSSQTQVKPLEVMPQSDAKVIPVEAKTKQPDVSVPSMAKEQESADEETEAVEPVKMAAPEKELPKSLDQAWVVQLGTFGNKENALKLRDKARAQGYSTHTTELQRDGKTLTRVFSGPFINREDADKVKALLDKKFAVKSIVVQFSE